MVKKRIVSIILTCVSIVFLAPTVSINKVQLNSEPKQLAETGENLDLRNYELEQVEEVFRVQIQKNEETKARELEEQKKIEESKKKIIYCRFEVSFYTTSADEGSGTGIGASGEYVQPWVSIALPKDIPFYSTATIEGLGTFINHDTGNYIQWSYDNEGNLVCRVDILVSTKEEAYSLGRYYANGYITINN